MADQFWLLGVPVDRVDFAQTLAQIESWVACAQPGDPVRQICTVNPEFLMEAQRNPAFRAALLAADLRVPDGVGVLLAARLYGQPIRERVTGSDGIYRISQRAADRGWRVYFLGAAPGVAEETAHRLTVRYPGLAVVGCYSGSPQNGDWSTIRARLHQAQPDVLFVAYGHPRQDLWIHQHRHELPAKVALGVGGAFDFVAGISQRAPLWMQRLSLEWLHRLITQPWRWRRMLDLPRFVVAVVRGRGRMKNEE
jgi:N-acetylglucosaminyldiphosphoundecaprenol N-acetyl-beta-D-mannosaminyltransferase